MDHVITRERLSFSACRLVKSMADTLFERGRLSERQHSGLLVHLINEFGFEIKAFTDQDAEYIPPADLEALRIAWLDQYGDEAELHCADIEAMCAELDLLSPTLGNRSKQSRQIRLAAALKNLSSRALNFLPVRVVGRDRDKRSLYRLEV